MSSGQPPVFRDHTEMIAYAHQHLTVPAYHFICPVCGNIRILSGKYVRRSDFAAGKWMRCWHCVQQGRGQPLLEHVKVRCSRCNKTRSIKRTTYRDKSYSKYCQTCSKIVAQKRNANNEWKQAALARLPETCNPVRDENHPSGNRQYFCLHYDKCLDVCVAKSWSGFVCTECSGGELEPLEQRMLPWSTIMEIMPDISFSG